MNKEDHIYTVNELIQLMKASLEGEFGNIRVKGEISNLVRPSSGHLYFTIKDEHAQIKVAMFKGSQAGLRFIPADGMQVILYGRVSIYEKRGDLQVYAQWLEPVGKGALYLAFEQLKEKLRVEGLFDPAHKRPIPLLPRRVGVITSPTGAAIQDILNVSERRFANIRILLYPVRVQGREAPGEIVEAISVMNELNLVDVLIVGRGGGSLEDLWAFNEEVVARAIFASKIPIISAVGHEIDFTISDFVCDLRAPTPSAAAELVVKNKQDLEARIDSLGIRATNAIKKRIEEQRLYFERLVVSPAMRRPYDRLNRYQQTIDDLLRRLTLSVSHLLERNRMVFEEASQNLSFLILDKIKSSDSKLMNLTAKLEVLSPLAVFDRGYSITYKLPEGEIIKDASLVKKGDKLKTRLKVGEIVSEVCLTPDA